MNPGHSLRAGANPPSDGGCGTSGAVAPGRNFTPATARRVGVLWPSYRRAGIHPGFAASAGGIGEALRSIVPARVWPHGVFGPTVPVAAGPMAKESQ